MQMDSPRDRAFLYAKSNAQKPLRNLNGGMENTGITRIKIGTRGLRDCPAGASSANLRINRKIRFLYPAVTSRPLPHLRGCPVGISSANLRINLFLASPTATSPLPRLHDCPTGSSSANLQINRKIRPMRISIGRRNRADSYKSVSFFTFSNSF